MTSTDLAAATIASRNKKFTVCSLIVIILISACVHFYRISYPAMAVFDEAHFATYAADYTIHKAFFDIHPALGKLLYAGAVWISGAHLEETQFILEQYDPLTKEVTDTANGIPYNNFPYVLLRSLSAIAGVLLVLVFYWFLRTIGVGNLGALLGTFFVSLDNALITQTRFILLDGFLWVLALSALIFYFRKPQRPLLAGFLWGLALAVKMSAAVFAGPILVYQFMLFIRKEDPKIREREKKAFFRFLAVGLVVVALVVAINPLLSGFNDQITTLNGIFGFNFKLTTTPSAVFTAPFKNYCGLLLVETLEGLGNYVGALGLQNNGSPWYLWPIKQIPMTYFDGLPDSPLHSGNIILDGNPVVWYASTLAIVFGLIACFWYAKKYARGADDKKSFFILLGGYVLTLLPFIFIVRRSTFLYHYLPSLLFAIGLLAWFIARALKLDDFDTLTKKQTLVMVAICALVFVGFLSAAPGTYGL